MPSVKKTLPVAVAWVALLLAFGVGEAGAAEPWWHVNTVYSPAGKNSGEGFVNVEVSNLGDARTNGTWIGNLIEAAYFGEFKNYVTIVDKLPPGLSVSSEAEEPIQPEGGGTELGRHEERRLEAALGKSLCSISGQTVTCKYGTPVRPYERITLAINVEATPGAPPGLNEVSVSGAGAKPVTSRRGIDPGEPVPPYGVESYEITPEEEGGEVDTQAGSHPFQLTTTLAFNSQTVMAFRGFEGPQENGAVVPEAVPLALTKDLRFKLPAGLLGNPTAIPRCPLKALLQEAGKLEEGTEKCPAGSAVGEATSIVANINSTVNIPYALSAPLFNLEPEPGEPARFGFPTLAGAVILDTSVRTGGDYGVTVTVPNIVDFPFLGSQVTFWGVPADRRHDLSRTKKCLEESAPAQFGGEELSCPAGEARKPLLSMPTSCTGPLHSTVEGDSWPTPQGVPSLKAPPGEYTFQDGPGGLGEPYGLDGCNRLSFEPSIGVTPDGQQASTPTGLTVGVHVSQQAALNPEGLADSSVRDTTVTLPAGVALNPAAADGLLSCSVEQVGLESPGPVGCPEASKVGTVEIHSPLLPDPLVGAAYLAAQDANPFGSLVALYLVAEDAKAGVLVKLAGEVKLDPVTGQIVSTFKNTPQLPFEDLKIAFFGGSRAPLGTPALCGSYTTTASFAPWSGTEAVGSSSEFQILSGPDHTPCMDPLPFAPSLTAGSLNIQAGAFTPFRMTMSREDGNQNLDAIELKMPPGLLGRISSVKLCGESEANAGTCGPESLIGHTIVSVGLGGTPFSVTGGEVFITGPYQGAPYGLSIVNPAKAGPFDLGKVIVRAKIEVDPNTAAITITSDPNGPHAIPQILDGIPLQIKHVNVTVDRPGFTFNPTDCSKLAVTGILASSQAATSLLSVPFQVTNCATLAFKPLLKASTNAHASRKRGASLRVKLTYPNTPFGTQADIAKVKVSLPKQLPSRLSTLQKACADSTFNRDPAACPPESRVGSATATTPVLPVLLQGPAYFVSHGGQKFPELIIVLAGQGVTIYLHGETSISKTGITSSTFRAIPDVPVGTFELNLPQGPYSALAVHGNLCHRTITVHRRVRGHSRTLHRNAPVNLAMPTTFVAQNGTTLKQNTKIAVTGCSKAKKKTTKR